MVNEILDKESGAILFKKSKEANKLELLYDQVQEMSKKIYELEEKIKELQSSK